MIINFINNTNLVMSENLIIKTYNDKINDFWTNEIWKIKKSNTHIKNKQVIDFFFKLKDIEKEYNITQVKFSINTNYDVMIEDNKKKIKKQISNLKKDNLPILKIHSDCFNEYHKIVFDYLNKKNIIGYYNLDIIDNLIPETNLESESESNLESESESNLESNLESESESESNLESEYILDDNLIKEQIISFKNKFIMQKNNNNLEHIINALEKNIFKIKEILSNIINKKNILEPILLIDVENILKSFEVQDFLKSHIDEDKFNKYFYTWNNGYFDDTNNIEILDNNLITLSEYSSKIKYMEPFTSLNLSFEKKLKLIKILIDKLNTNTINILTSSSSSTKNKNNNDLTKIIYSSNKSDSSTHSNHTTHTNLFIPIHYNDKFDIREQDDHLIILIYMILKKKKLNPIIISNDKFKWFECFDTLNIKNFKILYDYDLGEKKMIIDIPYTPSVYKINSLYYIFPFINYPLLEDNPILIQNITSITIMNNLEKILKTKIKRITLSDINIIYTYLFNLSIIETNIIINHEFILIIKFCLNYLEYTETKFNKIDNFLSSNSKEKIFKISIETYSNIFDKHEIKNYLMLMENYLIFIKIYIVIKFIIFKNYSNSNFTSIIIPDLCKIFDLIIGIYDIIDIHIYKIRKLSCSKSELEELFKKINTIYIYVRKQGYLKKNIY
jgi:hypothetical protein